MANNALRLKNKYLLGLMNWLNSLCLAGKESRERTRFVTVLNDHSATVEQERVQLIEKFCEKDENQAFKKKTLENGTEVYDIPEGKMEEFQKEFSDLMEEEFVLDVLEGNKSKISVVKDLVLNSTYKFGPSENDPPEVRLAKVRQAMEYDIWCEAFEKVEV